MPPSLLQAIAQSWIVPLWPTLGTLVVGGLYFRGWRLAHVTRPRELPRWRAACFFAGLVFLWLALASPLDALDQFLLIAHMTQHVVLMSVAPPLLLLGCPVVPLLRGLPRSLVRDDLAPWMNTRGFHRLQKLLTGPVFGWITMDLAVVLWHIPFAYELALRSNFWHQVEHGCFFFTSLAFWWYAVRPWPSRIRSSRWLILPYLASAHMVLFFVGLIIAFDPRVIYPTYAHVPRLFGISALTDQALAGGEMIFVGLVIIIASLAPVMLQLLSDAHPAAPVPARVPARPSIPFDLLRARIVGPILRSRYGRLTLQSFSGIAIAAVILDGLFGAQVAPLNLAGSFLWNVLRPINLLLLLLIGNLFCMACPFTLPRELARRIGFPQLHWPAWLSTKWLAAGLMLLFFWSYEQFALWRSPRDTAFLLIAYVGVAFLVNSVFRGASFCKYVCPVGQFNFIASLVAPFELGARSQQICSSCETHDCVRGNETHRGCELKLYVPNKSGNFDCTLCMDCVKACPSDNISITLQSPLRDLHRDPVRSSVGRTSARPDLAALVLVIVFSSIANAAVMIAPVAHLLDSFRRQYPWAANSVASLLATCLFSTVLLLLYLGAARLLQSFASRQSLRIVFCRFALALLPLGLSIWLGHLAFHLATTGPSIPALFQHLTMEVSTAVPATGHTMMAESSSSMFSPLFGANGLNLFDLQVWIVNLGLFVTWYAGRRLIREMAGSATRPCLLETVHRS